MIDVATLRDLNKASEHRNIAQPTLSQRISPMKNNLGRVFCPLLAGGVDSELVALARGIARAAIERCAEEAPPGIVSVQSR
ncbi:hypothetical protein [Pararhodobacter aggregans]|uniref:hypothetical protein n=1 Tax=Pararhodobacter aggregans TaxID=404875 RepID=UPI003A953072